MIDVINVFTHSRKHVFNKKICVFVLYTNKITKLQNRCRI